MAKKLSAYRAKRDFKKTSEPSGREAIAAAPHPRFVIQKHAATRLHYDLRLEVDGVFKSWAVTRGPSLDPADKRLAVEVEDHPLDYGDFEGTIPKGEYGGGTVMLWDRGFWQAEGATPVDKALAAGELKFVLAGEKLQGGFVLVRIKNDRAKSRGPARNNWLLIKHRDGTEQVGSALADDDRSVASGRSMEDIAAGRGSGPKPFMRGDVSRDLPDAVWSTAARPATPTAQAARRTARANVGRKPMAKTPTSPAPRTDAQLPQFIAPQLCQTVAHPPTGADWVHEIKLDGYRTQLRIADGSAVLRTRSGLDWTVKFNAIAEAARALPDAIIDGEVVALDANGSPDFAGLQLALSEERSHDLVFFAFDLLFAGGADLRRETLEERKGRLAALLRAAGHDGNGRIRYLDHLSEPGDAVLRSACRMELEGIVSKRRNAPYLSGRVSHWAKTKCRGGHEVVIGGWSGSRANLRSLIVGVYRGGHLVHTGRVGTGFTRATAKMLLAKLRPLVSPSNPFTGPGTPRREADVTWVEPTLVAEIEFAGWTGTGMVRQASFKGLREDKPAREVSDEKSTPAATKGKAKPSPDAALARTTKPAASPASARNNVVMGVTISSPTKTLWPAPETEPPLTKLDLAHYLEQVSAWMIEHLRGRPCSVIRAPDGIAAEQFFQRHAMPGSSNLLTLTTVSGDRKPYIQVDRIEALIALAQIAAVEFHPWNCEPGRPETPGRLVFDLDPAPDVPFTAVVAAAKELRERLDALGLVGFCKTTGGKGLHVVTPLDASGKRPVVWAQAKTFAQAVCGRMAADNPDRYLIKMTKSLRAGRIFLDYLRNDRMATAVAPLSPRARAGAPVSMPLTWTQVDARLDPRRFTLRTVPSLLTRSKAWADYGDAQRPLAAAIDKLLNE